MSEVISDYGERVCDGIRMRWWLIDDGRFYVAAEYNGNLYQYNLSYIGDGSHDDIIDNILTKVENSLREKE